MNKISIGRSSQNDYVINDRTEVTSRFHADLFANGDGTYTLSDHSTHGTTVNGSSLHNASRQVRYGDSIVFANTAQFDWSRVKDPLPPNPEKPMAPHAVASLVLGILSLVSWYGGLALGIVGLCLAANGLKRTRNDRERYRGIKMLKAGLICSIIALSIYAILLIVGLSVGSAALFYSL